MQFTVKVKQQIIIEFDFDCIQKAKKATELLHACNDDIIEELYAGDKLISVFQNGKWNDEI